MSADTDTSPLEDVKNPAHPGLRRALVCFRSGKIADDLSTWCRILPMETRLEITRTPGEPGSLVSPQISRRHAELSWQNGFLVVRDLGSKNGTLVNGRQVLESPLGPQDVLRFGDWVGVLTAVSPQRIASGKVASELEPGVFGGSLLDDVFANVRRLAPTDLRLLIVGETGTGKEVLARAVHRHSQAVGPYVAINAAAIPSELAEGELFGYRKGAFTGAERASAGAFRAAHGGTLLFDEVQDLPSALQAKLLRALEERKVVPLGQTTPEVADPRVISATQASLLEAVEAGKFRADLYARLCSCELRIPPLRDRREEILPLFAHLAGDQAQSPALSAKFMEQLLLYDWPMNARELVQLVSRTQTLHRDVSSLQVEHLPPAIGQFVRYSEATPPSQDRRTLPLGSSSSPPGGLSPRDELAQRFFEVLKEASGNITVAAERLGLSRAKAYRLLKRLPEVNPEELRVAAHLANSPAPTERS